MIRSRRMLPAALLAAAAALVPAGEVRAGTAVAPADATPGATQLGPHGTTLSLVSARRSAGVLTVVVTLANRSSAEVLIRELAPDAVTYGETAAVAVDAASGRVGGVLHDGARCRCSLLNVGIPRGRATTLSVDLADPGGDAVDVALPAFQPLLGVRPEGTAAPPAGLPVLAGRTADAGSRYRIAAADVAGGKVSLRTDVLFAIDKATLTANARATLAAAVGTLKGQPKRHLAVHGHTDDTGTAAHNLDLSQRRAQAVRDALAPQLGNGWTIDVQGFGETRPVAANERPDGTPYPDGRARNRRVEILIVG